MSDVETSLLRQRTSRRRPDPLLSHEADVQLVLYRQGRKTFQYLLRGVVLLLTIIVTAVAVRPWSYFQDDSIDPLDYAARTRRLLSQTPLIDGHNDLPYLIRLQLNNKIYNQRFSFSLSKYSLWFWRGQRSQLQNWRLTPTSLA